MPDIKSPLAQHSEDHLAKAEECLDLAATEHQAADAQHQIAARVGDNAKQQQQSADAQAKIAEIQHESADHLNASAVRLDALGRKIIADVVKATNASDEFSAPTLSPELIEKMERVRR
jgi:hypothetical protein